MPHHDKAIERVALIPGMVTTIERKPPAPVEALHDKLVSDSQFVREHAEYDICPTIDIEYAPKLVPSSIADSWGCGARFGLANAVKDTMSYEIDSEIP